MGKSPLNGFPGVVAAKPNLENAAPTATEPSVLSNVLRSIADLLNAMKSPTMSRVL